MSDKPVQTSAGESLIVLERPNPFDAKVERQRLRLTPGAPLSFYLAKNDESVVTFLDGVLIPPEKRASLIPRPGQQLVIGHEVGGGGGGKALLRALAMVAVMVVAIALPFMMPALAASSPALMAALVGAVGIGGSLLINALLPPPGPPKNSQNYGWNGASMTAQAGLPIPIQYGTTLRGPNVIQSSLSTTLTQQWLNILLDFGWGPAQSITQIKINGNPIENYPGVWTDVRLGNNDHQPIANFGDVVNNYAQDARLLSGATGFVVVGTGLATQAFELEFYFPSGLWWNNSGTYEKNCVGITVGYRLVGSLNWTSVLFPRITTALPLNEEEQAPYWIAVTAQWSPNANNTMYVLAVAYPSGAHSVGQAYKEVLQVPVYDANGNPIGTQNLTVTGTWQINPEGPGGSASTSAGTNYVAVTDYTTISATCTWNQTTPCRTTVRVDNLPPGQYEYMATKLGSNRGGSTGPFKTNDDIDPFVGCQTWLNNVAEITYDDVAYNNKVLLAVRALATNTLSGSLQVTAVVQMANTPAMGYVNEIAYDLPAAYYRMDDASDAACVDLAGQGHGGVYTGAPQLQRPGLIVGSPDTAVEFAATDAVTIAAPVSFAAPAAVISASVSGATVTLVGTLGNTGANIILSGFVPAGYNGPQTVASATLDEPVVTLQIAALGANSAVTVLGTIAPVQASGTPVAVTSATLSGGALTVASALTVFGGGSVLLQGFTPSTYNAHYTVVSVGSGTFVVDMGLFGPTASPTVVGTAAAVQGLGTPIAVTAASQSGSTITLQSLVNAGVGTGVVLAGFTPSGYNGTYDVTSSAAATPNITFTFTAQAALGPITQLGAVSDPSSTGQPFGNGWAVEFWLQPTAPGVILSSADGTVYVALASGGQVNFHFGGADHLTAGVLALNATHHVALGMTPGGFLFLLDGVPQFANLTPPAWSPAVFGHNANAPAAFAGVLDEVALYSYGIQPGRLRSHYITGTIGIHSALEGQAPSNPAMVVIDQLLNPLYGGQQLPSQVDVPAFAVYADFCNELVSDGHGGQIYRHLFNGVFDQQKENLWQAVGRVATMSRTAVMRSGTSYTCVCEAPATPSQIFTMGNIKRDSFKQSYPSLMDRANSVSGTFLDETNNYTTTPIRVMDEAAIAAGAMLNDAGTVSLFGITNPSAAWRELTYLLDASAGALPMVTIECALEGIAARVGDVVGLQHDVPQWGMGGRILAAASASQVTLDQAVTLAADTSYVLMLVFPSVQRATGTIASIGPGFVVVSTAWDGTTTVSRLLCNGDDIEVTGSSVSGALANLALASAPAGWTAGMACQLFDVSVIETQPVSTGAGTTDTLAVSTPFTAVPPAYALYFFGGAAQLQFYRISAVGRRSDQEMTLQLTAYDPDLYDDLEPTLPEALVTPDLISVTNLVVTEAPNATPQFPFAAISWKPGILTAGARIYVTYDGLQEFLVADVFQANSTQLPILSGYNYTFRVVGYNAQYYSGPYASAPTATLAPLGPALMPQNVSGFYASACTAPTSGVGEGVGASVTLYWAANPSTDNVASYQVYYGGTILNPQLSNSVQLSPNPGATATSATFSGYGPGQYLIIAVNTNGIQSAVPTICTAVVGGSAGGVGGGGIPRGDLSGSGIRSTGDAHGAA